MVILQIEAEQFESFITKAVNQAYRSLVEASAPTESTEQSQRYHPLSVVAERLDISKEHLRRIAKEGKIKSSKRGKKIYFYEDDIVAYIQQGTRANLQDSEDAAEQYLNEKGGQL
jgi:excisionase family DNA binding protein